MSAKKQVMAPVAVQLWDFWGGNDLGKALRDAASFIDGLGGVFPSEAVETVYCNQDDQGWFVSVLTKDAYGRRGDANT